MEDPSQAWRDAARTQISTMYGADDCWMFTFTLSALNCNISDDVLVTFYQNRNTFDMGRAQSPFEKTFVIATQNYATDPATHRDLGFLILILSKTPNCYSKSVPLCFISAPIKDKPLLIQTPYTHTHCNPPGFLNKHVRDLNLDHPKVYLGGLFQIPIKKVKDWDLKYFLL